MRRAHPDVPDVASLYHIVECLHGFLDGRVIVEAMKLQDVDVIKLETSEGMLHRIEDVLPAASVLIHETVRIRILAKLDGVLNG